MTRAIIKGDLVVGRGTGDVSGPDIPPGLLPLPDAALRWDGAALIDARPVSTFFIDAAGNRHLAQDDPSWQELACSWDDPLIFDAAAWSVEPLAERLCAYLADKRWRVECCGVMHGGHKLPSDRERRLVLISVAEKVRDGTLTAPVDVSLGPGVYLTVTQAELDAMIAAITLHVQACFSLEKTVAAEIMAGAITTTAEIDAAAWRTGGM